jgi:GGDEF domain-containing protein
VASELKQITGSIGIASFPLTDVSGIAEMVKCADIAMYQAKEQGGNRWVLFRPARA